jgi:hypothetical protein
VGDGGAGAEGERSSSAVESGGGLAAIDAPEARSRVTARVTTTVVLPPEALTLVLPPPEMLSQVNVEHVLGLPVRTYLELLREPGCTIAVTPVGKLRLVDRGTFRRWLEARATAKRAAMAIGRAPEVDDATLTVEEQVALGVKPAPRAATRR